ncbi:hypothetical protein ACO2KH_01925 [Leptospira terpstrae]|uniref:hypothetical protein n=1 Tax=Leptospira terpstrae TaxID=293075 RepID=UPI003D06D0CE
MLVNTKNYKLFFLTLYIFAIALTAGCIKGNNPNQISLLLPQITNNTNKFQSNDANLNGCILTYDSANESISTCFHLDKKDCNINFFLNISSEQILTKRKNDLSFLNINYSNCSNSGLTLVSKYNSLSVPSSVILKDILNINNLSELNNLRISNTYSCENSKFTQESLTSNLFERLLNKEELLSLNSLEIELSLISNTTLACMQDLNISNDLINFLSKIKDKKYLTGIPCSNSTLSSFGKCQN